MTFTPTRAEVLGALVAVPSHTALPARPGPGVPVLMYHAVNDKVPRNHIARGLTLPIARFEEQLRYLAAHDIQTLTAAELVEAFERGEQPHGVVLTFDDGYVDVAHTIAPLLQRYHARATFFVNSGSIGTPNHVTWGDLRNLHRAGMEIGAHGAHHLDLALLDRDGQMREAGGCVERIAQYAGFRPVSYAYASGRYNRVTLEVMSAIGIRSAWTEHSGPVRNIAKPYELPRLRIARDGGISQFAAIVAV